MANTVEQQRVGLSLRDERPRRRAAGCSAREARGVSQFVLRKHVSVGGCTKLHSRVRYGTAHCVNAIVRWLSRTHNPALQRPPEMIQGSCLCGSVQWRFDGTPDGATACNCTACRRYGVLWAYDYEGVGIHVSGKTLAYARGTALEFHFCPTCGCVAFWRGLRTDQEGRRRIAVNLRLAEPEAVANIPIDRFDGLDTFEDLSRDGRCVSDYWF